MKALLPLHFLKIIPLLLMTFSLPLKAKESDNNQHITPNWKKTTVYASAGGKNKDKGNLFLIRVLRSNPESNYYCQQRSLIQIPVNIGSVDLSAEPVIPFPKNVQQILDLEHNRKAFEQYKSTTGWFDYSYTTPRNSSTFFFEDAGDVFLLQKNQGIKATTLKVKHNFEGFHIHKCALDARNGLIPIAYSRKGGDRIGLVSVKTGQLKEVGTFSNLSGGFHECLKWLNDRYIALTFMTRWSSSWLVYDLEAKKIVAEGITELTIAPDNEYLSNFMVTEGQLFGLLDSSSSNTTSIQRLFPVTVKKDPLPADNKPTKMSNP